MKMKYEDEGVYFVLNPDATIRAVWDLTLFAAIIYQSLCLPMRIAFEMSSGDFLFYLEMRFCPDSKTYFSDKYDKSSIHQTFPYIYIYIL